MFGVIEKLRKVRPSTSMILRSVLTFTQSVKLEVEDNMQFPAKKTPTFTGNPQMHRQYYVKDHLGSVRAVLDAAGDLVGYDDYYPFSQQMAGRSLNTGETSKEKFTGHGLDTETGLLYAEARYYDPVIAR